MVKNLIECLKLTKQQIRELFFTIVLPVAAGIAIVAAVKPSVIVEANVLNICLISLVAVLPMWLFNNVVWSTIILSFFHRTVKTVLSTMKLSPQIEKLLSDIIDKLLDHIRFQVIYNFTFRHISSVVTASGYYITALVIYLTAPSKATSFLIFMTICLIPAVCYALLCHFLFSAIRSHFAKMSTFDIMEYFVDGLVQPEEKKIELLEYINQRRKEEQSADVNANKQLNSDGLKAAD